MSIIEIATILCDVAMVMITDPATAVQAICEHMIAIKLLWFCDGHPYLKLPHWYRCITDDEAVAVIAQLVPDGFLEKLPSRTYSECLARLKLHRLLQLDIDGARKRHLYEVNLKNGVYDVKTQKLREHCAEDVFNYILDCNYIHRARMENAPAFCKFVATSLQEKNLECLLRMTGYAASSLTQGRVAFLLHGKGSTGKSSYLNVLASFFPKELISTIRFSDMARETYKPAYIGKRVNISRETDQTPMRNEDGFKSLVSCEDTSGRMLYKNVQTIKSRVKFIFASNNDLVVEHPDDAFYDRWIVIRFTQVIPESNKDPDLEANMIAEKDIIMSLSLDTLKNLVDSRYDFRMSDDGKNYIAQKRALLHTDESFFASCIETDPSGSISHTTLLDSYRGWCKQNGFDAIERNTFYDRVRNYYPSVRDAKVKGLHSFVGIRFRQVPANTDDTKEA